MCSADVYASANIVGAVPFTRCECLHVLCADVSQLQTYGCCSFFAVQDSTAQEARDAMQLATTASATATEAVTGVKRAVNEMCEMRGRLGQLERRLDTLWQVQVRLTVMAVDGAPDMLLCAMPSACL